MRLVDVHVNECDVADEAHIGAFQVAAEDAVVQTRHEKERGQTGLGHADKADERAEEAVEEKVEVVEDEVKLAVAEEEASVGTRGEKEAAQVPDDYALEEEYCCDGQKDFGEILCDKVELG